MTIIDEFQTLFENDDEIAANAVEALTKISRKGVHSASTWCSPRRH